MRELSSSASAFCIGNNVKKGLIYAAVVTERSDKVFAFQAKFPHVLAGLHSGNLLGILLKVVVDCLPVRMFLSRR